MRCRPFALTLVASLAAATSGVPTARADDCVDLQRCAAIPATAARVACYDELARQYAEHHAATPAPSRDTFGSTPARAPTLPTPEAIKARVTGLGRSANARPTVELDNGQVWELDSADGLLAAGDEVTIRHGALTSFLLDTPQQHRHRVRRLR